MAVAAGIGAVGSIAGGILGSRGASRAAGAQVQATQDATGAQMAMFDAMRQDLDPFKFRGWDSVRELARLSGISGGGIGGGNNGRPESSLLLSSAPGYNRYPDFRGSTYNRFPDYRRFMPTMQQLEQTPGYKFALDQGLKAVTNKMAASGLVGSGAQGRGLIDYATGRASQTYQQQFENNLREYETGLTSNINQFTTAANNNRLDYSTGLGSWLQQFQTGYNAFTQNQNNIWNKLYALAGLGQGAAAQTGQGALATGAQIGGNLIGAGNASAAGTIGATNALTGSINGVASNLTMPFLYNRLIQPSTPAAAAAPSSWGTPAAGASMTSLGNGASSVFF